MVYRRARLSLSVSGTFTAGVSAGGSSGASMTVNFGQRPFAYTAPSGFKALCTANLPAPTIVKPSTVMDVKLYTGNGTTQNITGLGFNPDLVWMKVRNYHIYYHELVDSVRGVNKSLFSNATDAEATINTLTAFNSDGFTVSTNGGANVGTNDNGRPFVAWCWDAGTTTTTNTQGSISSQVRANASAGFSVVTATKSSGSSTAQTFGHGLGVEPHMIILKRRNGSESWYVYNKVLGNAARLQLNETSAVTNGSGVWGSTTPTSQVFTVQSFNDGDFVAYCFAPVAGYSSFGSYTGNGSADGPFVYTNGMRPRWVMIKRSSADSSGGNWIIKDTLRPVYNTTNLNLFANSSTSESTEYPFDILSSGFKIRDTNVDINTSGATYIYAAFAESPFAANNRAR